MNLLLAPLPRPVRPQPANRFRPILVDVTEAELTRLHTILTWSVIQQLGGHYESSFTTCELIRLQEWLPITGGNLVMDAHQWHLLTAYVSHLVRVSPANRDALLFLLYRLKRGVTTVVNLQLWH